MSYTEQTIADALEKVLPDAVWPVVLPQSPTYPAMSFHRLDYERKTEGRGESPLKLRQGMGEKSTFQVVIYAKQYTKCAELLRKVKTEMEKLDGFLLESVEDGFEYDQVVFAMITQWSVWGELETDLRQPAGSWPVLETITTQLLAYLTQQLSTKVKTISAYDPTLRNFKTPALILDIESLEAGQDKGDGRTPLQVSFMLHCLMPAGTTITKMQSMAAEVFACLYQNSFGDKNITTPTNFTIQPAAGWPGAYGFLHWTINWQQTLYIGQSIWKEDGPKITRPLASSGSAIGEGFKDQYEDVL